jgi:hypothetical protein
VLPEELPHHDAGDLRAARLRIGVVHAVVADHWRRHHDDLTLIRGIGEDLLISAHVRREDDLGDRRRGGRRKCAVKKGSVFEEKEPWCCGPMAH